MPIEVLDEVCGLKHNHKEIPAFPCLEIFCHSQDVIKLFKDLLKVCLRLGLIRVPAQFVFPKFLRKLAQELGRIAEIGMWTRCIKSRNQATIDRIRGVRKRHINHANPFAFIAQDLPKFLAVNEPSVQIVQVIAVRFMLNELKDAVLAWILAGHERSPRLGRQRMDCGFEFPPCSVFHHFA